MKIAKIHLLSVGPISHRTVDLHNQWTGGTHEKILLSGPNGTGKSTILRSIAYLWDMAGQWLATPNIIPKGRSKARTWLRSHVEAVGVILCDVPNVHGTVGLYFGSRNCFEEIKNQADNWMGELDPKSEGQGRPRLIHNNDREWISDWSQSYKILHLGSFEPSSHREFLTPNIIYLEAEERKWVRPKGDPNKPIPDDPSKRWLVTYQPTEKWEGQLEASLVTLKLLNELAYKTTLADINRFFMGKQIRYQPTDRLRLVVDITNQDGKYEHPLDELSSGERQVLIQLYLISRWLQPGGVVLLDEPDLHLHPSLIRLFLSRVEAIVAERQGQLFITSHMPELWREYEIKGHREMLGGDL